MKTATAIFLVLAALASAGCASDGPPPMRYQDEISATQTSDTP